MKILYADSYLLAVDKSAGLLCVPGRGADRQDSLSTRLQSVYPEALVVHRLDQATSGVVLFARSRLVQTALHALFRERKIEKAYYAVAAGKVFSQTGLIDIPLVADWIRRPRQMVDAQQGKPSQTRWQVLHYDCVQNCTHLRLYPITGRSHQLRLHMATIGHPLLGDDLYADKPAQAAAPRLLLHATHLAFQHPVTRQPCAIHAPVPF